jgi:tetratricopeptide (TPR) repeat protein
LEQAQDLVYDALERNDPDWQITQAQRALEICPDCADAYTILAEYAPYPAQALMLSATAVDAALRSMDHGLLESAIGNFWAIHETRPYMRARLALARQLWAIGRRDESITHLRDLLQLNADDNQGVRYILASQLLEGGRDEEIQTLLQTYDEESTFWCFFQALAAFRREGDTPQARLLLGKARKVNPHVVSRLLDGPADRQYELRFGNDPGAFHEANNYVNDLGGGWRQTPGAFTWLRRVVADSKSRKRGARAAVGPTADQKKRLLKVPQRFGAEWQASVHLLPTWVEEAGGIHRPWTIIAVDSSERLILGQEMVIEPPTGAAVFDLLAKSMERPFAGEPHRPSEIQVREEALWEEIRPHLEEIGVDCIYRAELDEIAFIQGQMQQMFLSDKKRTGLVEIPGIELAHVGSFFAAAAEFYHRAPWRRVPAETAIRVECDHFKKHRKRPSYAVVMGQNNVTLGLALYESLDSIRAICDDDSDGAAALEPGSACSLMFSEPFEIPITDLLAGEANHWQLGGPEAYPMVLSPKHNSKNNQPKQWELHFLEGCLRAIPQFVEQHELVAEPAEETITVSTSQGNLTLKLSWEPDFESCGGDCDDCHDHCEHDH